MLSGLVSGSEQIVPMEVDRSKGKGKRSNQSKGYGGKPKGRGDKGKGDAKGKNKGKDGKGKSKKGQDKGKGKSEDRSKGKGNGDKQCHTRGRYGHFARGPRLLAEPAGESYSHSSVQQSSDTMTTHKNVVQGSPLSSADGSFTQASGASIQHQQSQQQGQSSQYQVARTVEDGSCDLVFDYLVVHVTMGICVLCNFTLVMMMKRWNQQNFQQCQGNCGGDCWRLHTRSYLVGLRCRCLSVYIMSLMNAGLPLNTKGAKLCDAQGKQIAVESMRLVEIRLPTTAGRTVVLKERVAISSRVTQPIPCFGYLLEHGFAIDGVEQALIHASGKINIPAQMQNKSMTILGHVRVLLSAPGQDQLQLVRAVRAEVMDGLINSLIGWTVSDMGYIVGRHLSDSFQDPSLAFSALQGPHYRNT